MRLPSIFLLFFLIAITQAQRRTTAKPDPSSETSRPVTRGRGRSRFVSSPEFQAIKETPQATPDPTSRRIVSRKRVPENIEHKLSPRPTTESIERRSFSPVESSERRAPRPASTEVPERRTFKTVHKHAVNPSYQVQEVVDETVHEPFRRLKKTRVLTESNFEAQNPPRRNSIQALPGASEYADSPPPRRQSVQSIPVAQENTVRKVKKLVHQESTTAPPPPNLVEEESNAVEEPVDTTAKSASLEVASEESTSEETQGEILKTQTVTTTTKLPEAPRSQNGGNRRSGARRNPNAFAAEATTSAGRSRMRTRGTRGPDTLFEPAPSAIPSRTSRRRIDSTVPVEGARKGPSVFSADFLPREGRSRTGRRTEALAPEKITLDLPSRDKSSARKKTSSTTKRSIDDPRNRSSWKQSPPSSVTSRGRSRSRDLPPVIDETKLEVLPLFENEPKLVRTDTRSRSRSRSASRTDDVATNFIQESRTKNKLSEELPVQESIQTSATDTDLKLTKPDRVTMSVNVETRSESSLPSRKPTQTSPPKESVVSEVSEITSRRTVLRRKTLRGVIKPSSNDVKPKILIGKLVPGSRGQKKSEIKLDGVVKKGSSDEIDESDNYPETFKALIKAKKGEKESMPASSSARITYSVNSSTTARSTTASGTTREINEQENELIPKSSTSPPSTRSTRNRPLQITTTDKNTANRKLTAPTLSRLSKYKSKYSPPSRNLTALKLDRNVAFRPREGYSTEKNKRKDGYGGRRVTKNAGGPVILSTQIPEYATSSRTSIRGKYRKEFSSRGPVVRSTTNAPRYIPTIPSAPYVPTVPTVTPSRPTVTIEDDKDPDLGLEVISFEDPVRPVQSANLVSGDYVSSSANTVALPLVTDGTTEKPVSIIERIINSITAISTSSPPSVPSNTASTTESASAIQKLAPKKTSRQVDSTDTTLTYTTTDRGTTEKPTTIIERILSSLTAIQATDNISSAQVRTDFNTLSFSTTPTPKVAKTSTRRTTLPEHISTSVNPLSVLDDVTQEQALEKRTIGKLLDILNKLVSTPEPPQNLVVVTPKSFVTSTNEGVGFSSDFFSSTALPLTSTNVPGTTISTSVPVTQSTTTVEPSTTPVPMSETKPPTITSTASEAMPSTTTVVMVTSADGDLTTLPSIDLRFDAGDSEMLGTSSTTTETQLTTTLSSTGDSEMLGTSTTTTASSTTPSSTESTTITSFPSTTDVGISSTTDAISFQTLLSTLPSLQKFHVSPGSVSVFSANDLINAITPEDNFFNTVTIASRFNFDNTGTTQSSTTTEDATMMPTTTETSTEEVMVTTTGESTTAMSGTTEGSTVVANNASADESLSVSNQTERVLMTSDGTTEGSSVVVNSTTTNVSNRSGRLLNIVQDPVENSIDVVTPSTTTSTTPDYYIFAVLNNNTILRKKPPTVPNKNVPFLIVGLLPNNTIVRKYPNGTIVPMERIIRVRGFDTRENPPPLPEITSNQVTNDPGGSENRKAKTVDQNTIPTIEANPLSLDSVSTSTTPETIIASSRTSPSTIRTESRFGSSSTDAQGTTTSSTSTTTGTTPSTTTSTTTSTTPGTTSTSSGTTLGPVGAISSETSTSDVKSSSIDSGSVSSDASTTPVEMMTLESSTIGTSTFGGATNPTPETLSQLLLNGRTLEAFNDIVNSAQTSTTDTDTNYQTPQGIQIDLTTVEPPSSTTANFPTEKSTMSTATTSAPTTSKAEPTTIQQDSITLSNAIVEDQPSTTTTIAPTTALKTPAPSTTVPTTIATTTTTKEPTTTTAEVPTTTTTQLPTTTTTGLQPRYTSTPTTTVLSTPRPTTLSTLPTATIFPTFLTTLFPNLFLPEVPTTRLPKPRGTRAPEVVRISAAPSVTETIGFAASSTRATTVAPPTTRITTRATTTTTAPTTTTTIPTTTTPRITTTTTETTTRQTTTTTVAPTVTTNAVEVTTVKKLKQLTEEQKENLRTLRKLEEEQSALLKQLSFLTSLNLGGAPKRTGKASKPVKPPNDNLAERVIELALARDKTKTTTSKPPTSIQDQLAAIDASKEPKKSTPSIEDVLKQYNLGGLDIATTPKASVYGNSEDAILASILKEQGFAPPTPKSLGDQIKQAGVFESTSKRPKPKPRTTTTPRPGPLMRGLDWLLNALAPTTQPPLTRRPAKPKPVKPKKPPVDEELLANSPTHITPVVTASPSKSQQKSPPKQVANALTQDDIQKLIKQLEGLQKDPSKGVLDLSQVKSIQNLINTDDGVVVSANGEHGATSRMTTTIRSTTQRRQERKLSTRAPQLTVSNSIEDFEVPTTSKPMRAPVGFRPVPGVDDDSSESLVRSNLITAAVNVTKAISGFLGTALQGAAQSFQSLLGSGSSLGTRVLGSAASGSSAGPG